MLKPNTLSRKKRSLNRNLIFLLYVRQTSKTDLTLQFVWSSLHLIRNNAERLCCSYGWSGYMWRRAFLLRIIISFCVLHSVSFFQSITVFLVHSQGFYQACLTVAIFTFKIEFLICWLYWFWVPRWLTPNKKFMIFVSWHLLKMML